MSLTPTRRRNGTDMVTIKVTHHLSKRYVAQVVMSSVLTEEEPDDVTKRMVEEAVRDKTALRGTDWADWVMDDYTEDEYDAAEAVVDRLWPGWKGSTDD